MSIVVSNSGVLDPPFEADHAAGLVDDSVIAVPVEVAGPVPRIELAPVRPARSAGDPERGTGIRALASLYQRDR
jgi:hypothetical protein